MRLIQLSTVTAALWLATPGAHASNALLWYNAPGTVNMTQGLFVGNGRMGAVIPGTVAAESIVLNESSLWAGNANLSGGYDTGPTGNFGAYQLFGNLLINLPGQASYTGYQRALDLSTGVATVDYTNNGIAYHREMFCSAPDQVLVVQLSASAAGAYTGNIQLADGHSTTPGSVGGGLMFSGALANGQKYEAQLQATNSGGTLVNSGGTIAFTNCNSLTLVVALGTDYVMDYSRSYKGSNPHTTVVAQAQAAIAKSFSTLQTAHTNDFQALFTRVSIDLGTPPAGRTNLPTDQRLTANIANDDDPGMDGLLFQYGRYLMISGSRSGCPLNLQGIWNDNNSPPWASDYHSDLNIEMMYNQVEVGNMSECFQPFINYLQSQIPAWRYVTTNKSYSSFGTTNGWETRASHNIYGGQGWNWIEGANAWYCLFLWDHFAFTRDTNYLRNTAYPMLKETCQFFQQYLKALPYATNGVPAGTLVVPKGWSPEHGPDVEDGVTCDQVLVWDVFNNCQQAASILNTDAVYAASVAVSQANLLKPRIGSWGQLREWFYTQDTQGHDGNSSYMQMIGIYPGRQLVPEVAPWLAAGVRTKLASVGDTYNGDWDYIQHVTYYARLHDWQSAQHVLKLYYGVVFPNLMANVLGNAQLDSTCGVTAAIAELLLQSHAGYINLLPTLPLSWPAGSVSGLRARGGYTVGITWTNAAGSATVIPDYGGACTVHAPNPPTVTLGGVPVAVTNVGFGSVQWPVVAGSNYVVQWVQPPFPAQTPAPADYATWLSGGNVMLTWVPGSSGYLHDVYFGSDSNAVASATTASPQYLARTNGTSVGVTVPVLQTNAPYFWRVDEVAGTNVGRGTLWQFTLAGTGPLAYSTATNNGNCIISFTNGSGLWTPPAGVSNVEVLVVGGGGGGGGNSGGGGGGGGVIHSNGFAVSGPVTVAVGAGGVGGISGSAAPGNGSSSVFSSLTAMGSGSGASYGGSSMSYPAGSGGSGGGGCWPATPVNCTAGGSGTAGQGYSGGGIGSYSGGGGGGASAAGASGSGRNGGNGGNGAQYSISGTAVYYGGGGGGGGDNGGSGTGGSGGLGGGGNGSNSGSSPTLPVAGTTNTGGGGGGGCNTSSSAYQSGAAGGSGVVIVRYPVSVPPPAKLGFSSVPTNAVAGQPFSVTLQALDTNGVPQNVTNNTTVQLSIASGPGTLSGTTGGTITNGTNSVTISGVIYSAGGAMNLQAATTSGMSLLAATTNLAFSAGPAKLVFSAVPVSPMAGAPFSVTLQAQDTNNVLQNVTNATTVQLSVTSGSGTLSGATSGTITSGTSSVTISGVIYSAPGAMTLQAATSSGTSLTSVTTNLTFGAGSLVSSTVTNGGNIIVTFTSGNGAWTVPSGVGTVQVLVVGGGGGGGGGSGGGGGGGGVTYSNGFPVSGAVTVSVGGGGAGCGSYTFPTSGTNSLFSTLTAYGGGSGASTYGDNSLSQAPGSGGSGGGGNWVNTSGGGGTNGQGKNGGTMTSSGGGYAGAGGGGAGGAGGANNIGQGGAGGVGVTNSISGSALAYGGGGGGGADVNRSNAGGGAGGSGVGGKGSDKSSGTAAAAGTANTGGGGGGGANPGVSLGGAAGGSGVVIVSYLARPVLPVSGVTVSNGVPSFAFTAAKGCMYRLDYKNALTDAAWGYGPWSTNTTGGGLPMTLTDTSAVGQRQRFYRLEAANP